MDKKKGSDMLNIKTEEQVTTKTVHKVGIWLTLIDLKRIMTALAELESFDNLSSKSQSLVLLCTKLFLV